MNEIWPWGVVEERSLTVASLSRFALGMELGRGLALGGTLGEERSLTVASLLRFALGIEVGAKFGPGMDVGCGGCRLRVVRGQPRMAVPFKTYRPACLLAVKQENPPNGGRIPF